MKALSWLLVLFGSLAFVAAPLQAQEAGPAPQAATPGLLVVGHGPDVPNGEPAPGECADSTQLPAGSLSQAGPPVFVVVVPVPIVIQRHQRREAGAVASAPENPNPTGRFINDPSRRFINDPSRRFINPPVQIPNP